MSVSNYATQPVPLSERTRWYSFVFVLVSIGIDISSLYLGKELSEGLSLRSAMFAIMVGSGILAVITAVTAYMAADTGLSTAQITNVAFGRFGAIIYSVVVAICLLGWFIVQLGFLAENIALSLEKLGVSRIPHLLEAIGVIGGALMILTVIYGYKAMEKLAYVAVPLLIALVLAALILALQKFPAVDHAGFVATMPLGKGISLVISLFLLGMVMTPDIARYGISPREAAVGSFLGMYIGNAFMIIVAVILAKTIAADNVISIFASLGSLFAMLALLVLVLAQWTTNNANIYSASVASGFLARGKISHAKIVMLLGGIALVGYLLRVAGNVFSNFLSALGVILSPIISIYLVDYFLLRREKYFSLETKRVNPRAFAVWVASSVLTALTTYTDLRITTMPAMDGILTAGLAYFVLGKLQPHETTACPSRRP